MLKLDGLTVAGFKSFASRTDLVFPEGVTCVVGPNGCGKSNVVDAIAWVLGEQSAKNLRGSRMEEVIFAGTRGRKPAGMAEVTLRFSPREGAREALEAAAAAAARDRASALPNEGASDDAAVAEAGESVDARAEAAGPPMAVTMVDPGEIDARLLEPLTITRRLYRNGDSEYLINEQRVRLRDVVQLIMGTGLGARVYSIIEQGRVEQILNSKPTDRRVLIEEAAGITRYKAKRRGAKLKLDESEQSLLRVTDITAELEKQLRSLRRQVGAARRYRRLAARRRVVLRALHAVKFRALDERAHAAEVELARLRAGADETSQSLAALEETARASRERVAESEAGRDAASQELHALQLDQERSRHLIEAARNRLVDLETRAHRAEREAAEVAESRTALEGSRTAAAETLEQLDGELAEQRGRLEQGASAARTARERLVEAQALIAETKENIFEVMSEAAGMRNRKQEVEGLLVRIKAQVGRLTGLLADAETEVARTSRDLLAGEAELTSASDKEQAGREALATVGRKLESLAARTGSARAAHETAIAALNDTQWRLSAVAEALRCRAAHAEGVRLFLDAGAAGVRGTVADFITVKPGTELACELALGPMLHAVVFDARSNAEAAARGLAERREPEVPFVFPDDGEGTPASTVPAERLADRAVVAALGECVTFPLPGMGWLARVVPQAWVVATAADAVRLARKHPTLSFVSRDGALIGPGGQGAAGRPLGEAEGILETRARHDALAAEAESQRTAATQHGDALRALEKEHGRLVEARSEAADGLVVAEKVALGARLAVGGLRQAAETAHARLAAAQLEHESALSDETECVERLSELALKLAGCSATKADLERQHARTVEQAERLERTATGGEAELSDLREGVAARAERRSSALGALERIDAEIARADERADRAGSDAASMRAERTETESLLHQTQAAVAAASKRLDELKGRLADADARVRDGRGGLVDGAERLRDLRFEHDRRARLVSETEVRRERLVSELEHLVADCREKLSVEPGDLPLPEPPAEVETPPRRRSLRLVASAAEATNEAEPAAEGAVPASISDDAPEADAELEPETPADESLPWREGVIDLAALEVEAEDLRRRLDRIGPVNLVAIEEYDELSARHGFLTKERSDLDESIRQLRATIAEIDLLSRERFAAAFEAVRATFDQAFQTLFRGGRAELRLQDDEDPLECGIEIIAQPPGKRLQNMLLMSGGEKALTAIALLFALFRYKPSPFCVLDEVDAPLDESNVMRFIDLVQELSKDTQFVLITHNRRSMERASVLYGVTMQEPGCSKLVAVNFEGLGRESAA